MTITPDQDRSAYEWAQIAADNNADPSDAPWRVVARHYLDTVDAPAPTLAEELAAPLAGRPSAEHVVFDADSVCRLAARAGQIEKERDEARAEVIRQREIIRKHKEQTDRAVGERDEALAEVERLTAERDRIASGRHITYTEVDGELLPDPADVPAGQPWLVQDNDGTTQDSGSTFVAIAYDEPGTPTRWRAWDAIDQPVKLDDTDIKLFARLVPAPRTITTVEELDALPHDTIIMAGDTAYQRGDESHAFLADWWHPAGDIHSETSTEVLSHAPATVLHQPEGT